MANAQGVIFGHDVSHHQPGIDVGRLAGQFIVARTGQAPGPYRDSKGNLKRYGRTVDTMYKAHKSNAARGGKLFSSYFYLGSDYTPDQNAAMHAELEPDRGVPVMLDWEKGSGNVAFFRSCVDAFRRAGYGRVWGSYAPKWYLDEVGGGSLAGLPKLVASKYATMTPGSVSSRFALSSESGWNGYGGNEVLLYQFSSVGRDPAYPGTDLDCLAFRGTIDQLRAIFYGSPAPRRRKSGDDLAMIESYDPCPRGADGKLVTRHHTFVLPVGSVSQVTDKAWLSFKCMDSPGGAEYVRLMSIRGDDKKTLPGGNYPVDKEWTNVAADHVRVYIEAADGSDQFVAYVRSEKPYSLCIEILPR